MELSITPLARFTRATHDVEIVERKGLGHPDTTCDALAEQLSVALCRYDLEHFDPLLHHNNCLIESSE
jgi:S-adenosylmethionine synthetase